jgi:hypothetical protein
MTLPVFKLHYAATRSRKRVATAGLTCPCMLWQAEMKAEMVQEEKAAIRRATAVDSHRRKRESVWHVMHVSV